MGAAKVRNMELLDSSIRELYTREPYWNMCNPCRCGGCCCIGADISISEGEWQTIKQYVQTLPEEDKSILANNIKTNNLCVFRALDKCLIHDVRTEDCRYTPYQYVVTVDNRLIYSELKLSDDKDRCVWRRVEKPITPRLAQEMREQEFFYLPNFGRSTLYLSLNWQIAHSPSQDISHNLSEWLQIESLIR